jgi:hypothetical protein
MICYTIPSMSIDAEFSDLNFVGRYVDRLIESTGDSDYAIVYEWRDDGPTTWPPIAVLVRRDGRWVRRRVISSGKKGTAHRNLQLELGPEEDVNGH